MDEEHTWRCDLAADDDVRQSHAGSNLPGVPRPLLLTDNGDQWTHLSVLRRSSGGRRLTSETGQGWVRARWKLNLRICFTNGTFDQDPFIYIYTFSVYVCIHFETRFCEGLRSLLCLLDTRVFRVGGKRKDIVCMFCKQHCMYWDAGEQQYWRHAHAFVFIKLSLHHAYSYRWTLESVSTTIFVMQD